MILASPAQHTISSVDEVASDSAYVRKASESVAFGEPRKDRLLGYEFEKDLLSLDGGKLLLRLRHKLTVELDPFTMECGVADWQVRLPVSQVAHLPARLARQFLNLFSKADRGWLNKQEENIWLKIIDQVDYRRFSIDRAAPQYLEGTVRTKQPNFIRVSWHDGTEDVEKILRPVCSALEILDVGDEFSAYVKLGLDNKATAIERVSILSVA